MEHIFSKYEWETLEDDATRQTDKQYHKCAAFKKKTHGKYSPHLPFLKV